MPCYVQWVSSTTLTQACQILQSQQQTWDLPIVRKLLLTSASSIHQEWSYTLFAVFPGLGSSNATAGVSIFISLCGPHSLRLPNTIRSAALKA